MAYDTTNALGAPEIVGALVNPKGLTKKMTAATAGTVVGGVVGTMAARKAVGDAYEGAPDVPNFGRVGYLTTTATEVALLRTKSGALRMKITDEVLARVPRTAITSVEWDGGMLLSHLTITFANDRVWQFDIPKAGKKTGETLVRELGGTT